ncbi:MAG: winged helix-turn-helix domain-containing protein [Caulobacteraceae bacterium]
MLIDPANRRVVRDDGREAFLEPRVMQVLLALIQADGGVLTRDGLLGACWGGVVVGEDALNRVIGRLRRLSKGLGEGVFHVETVIGVGYRLVGQDVSPAPPGPPAADGGAELELPAKPSIAVLAFKNVGGDPDKDYLADGVAEDIITALSRWRWFFVIARTSSFAYRDQGLSPASVGQALGARYILTGAIRSAGANVRVTAQLIDGLDGSTLWADRFDRPLTEMTALQDEIAEHIAAAIGPAMLAGEGARVARKSPADFSALDCTYRGMWWLNKLTEEADAQAEALFRQAVGRDPDLALAHAGLARSLYARALYRTAEARLADFRESLAEARLAIRLDPTEATGYYAAAGAALYLGQHGAALDDAGQTLARNPNFAYAHYRLGQVLIFAGRPLEALAPLEHCIRLSPCDPQLRLVLDTLALAHYQAGDYAAAVEWARRAGRLMGGAASTVLAAGLARLGRMDEAAEAFARVDRSKVSRERPLPAPYADPAHLEHIRGGYRAARAASSKAAV